LRFNADREFRFSRRFPAIVVVTEWKEFITLDWKSIHDTMNKPAFIFDGRNILKRQELKDIGFKVGRRTGLAGVSFDMDSCADNSAFCCTFSYQVVSIGTGDRL